eukprot:1199757-Rhodomonas_salina.1
MYLSIYTHHTPVSALRSITDAQQQPVIAPPTLQRCPEQASKPRLSSERSPSRRAPRLPPRWRATNPRGRIVKPGRYATSAPDITWHEHRQHAAPAL